MQNRSPAESKRASPSRRLRASGFSQSTGLPAAEASRAGSRGTAGGVGAETTSTSGAGARSSDDAWGGGVGPGDFRGEGPAAPRGGGPAYSRAKASADPGERDPTAAMVASGTERRLIAKSRAILPVARIPQWRVEPVAGCVVMAPSSRIRRRAASE